MDEQPEIECTECGWQGYYGELVCSSTDSISDLSVDEIDFNRCPDCDSVDSCNDYED